MSLSRALDVVTVLMNRISTNIPLICFLFAYLRTFIQNKWAKRRENCEEVRFKQTCSATQTSWTTEILPVLRLVIFAHRIRISEILHWDRKSYITHAIPVAEQCLNK